MTVDLPGCVTHAPAYRLTVADLAARLAELIRDGYGRLPIVVNPGDAEPFTLSVEARPAVLTCSDYNAEFLGIVWDATA